MFLSRDHIIIFRCVFTSRHLNHNVYLNINNVLIQSGTI